jgi:TonB family protein
LERLPPLEPPQESSTNRSSASQAGSLAEAAAIARAARSNFESPPEDFDAKRIAVMVGGGAAVVLAVVVLGFKLFGSKNDAPHPAAAPVAHAPQYPQEVTDLIAQTESALKTDDLKGARADVDKLRQVAPSHPRLAFFEGLLAEHSGTFKGGSSSSAAGRTTTKHNGQPSRPSGSNAGTQDKANVVTGTAGSSSAATRATSITDSKSTTTSPSDSSPQNISGLAPETPPGMTRSPTASAAPQSPHEADVPASAGPTTTATTAGPPVAVSSGRTSSAMPASSEPSVVPAPPPAAHTASTSATRRPSSGEPPPVIQEPKVIRRVVPDYPSAAKRDGIAGSVDLEVTVSSRGIVEDVTVIRATPPDMFEKSAVAAVRKWKYDPRFVDGLPSEAHVKVHLDFGPGK